VLELFAGSKRGIDLQYCWQPSNFQWGYDSKSRMAKGMINLRKGWIHFSEKKTRSPFSCSLRSWHSATRRKKEKEPLEAKKEAGCYLMGIEPNALLFVSL